MWVGMGTEQGHHGVGMGTVLGYCGVVMDTGQRYHGVDMATKPGYLRVDTATDQGYHGVGMGTRQGYHGVSLLGHATSVDWLLGDSKVPLKQPLQMLPLAASAVTFVLYKKWSNFLKIKSCRIFSSPKKS